MERPSDVIVIFRLLLILPLVTSGWSLRVSGLRVPPVVVSGSTVRLMCSYEKRTDRPDPLYSIKWYRGFDQFYEYVPKKIPPVRVYPLPNLHVDENHSDSSTVVLRGVTRESSGTFRCEVMGDKPHFETDDYAQNMTVLDIPPWGPDIRGMSSTGRVKPGDVVRTQCLVGPSNPDVTITWSLNSHDLPTSADVMNRIQRDSKGRRMQSSELTFEVTESSFRKGAITVTCEAKLSTVFQKATNVTLVHAGQPQPAGFGWSSSGSQLGSNGLIIGILATGMLVRTTV